MTKVFRRAAVVSFIFGNSGTEASIDALALLTADVLLALDPELDRSVDKDVIQNQQEVTADYQHERRTVLQGLYRELQERFPPKH